MAILEIRDKDGNIQEVLALKGDKGDRGDQGIQGIQGPAGADGYTPIKGIDYFDGQPGKDGYTPIKGVDYFTTEDVQEIAEQAAEMVEVPDTYTRQEIDAIMGAYITDGEWKHINTITLTEAVREVTISEDTDGNPFALTEVFIRQNVSCGAASNQGETVYVNGIGVIGGMDIVKNTGYYAWSDIVLSVEAGKIVVRAAYSDFALSNPGGYNTHLGYGTALKTFRNVSFLDAESIQTIKFSCTDVNQAFAQNSSFTIWGR